MTTHGGRSPFVGILSSFQPLRLLDDVSILVRIHPLSLHSTSCSVNTVFKVSTVGIGTEEANAPPTHWILKVLVPGVGVRGREGVRLGGLGAQTSLVQHAGSRVGSGTTYEKIGAGERFPLR